MEWFFGGANDLYEQSARVAWMIVGFLGGLVIGRRSKG